MTHLIRMPKKWLLSFNFSPLRLQEEAFGSYSGSLRIHCHGQITISPTHNLVLCKKTNKTRPCLIERFHHL